VRYQSGRSPTDHRDSFVDHTVTASFNDFLDAVERSPRTGDRPYLIAHDRLLDKAPFRSLLEDIDFDPRYLDGKDTRGRVFFWLGPPGSMTPMHRDLGNVYLAQIMGRKLIRLVPSKELHLMYNEFGYHSEADFDALSFDDFPLLKGAHIIEEVIRPGDFLFIPVGWWHFVKSLDTTITITGNNFRFPNALRPIFD
jgi:Cupin-like domain